MTWPVPGARVPTNPKLQWGNQRSATHTHNGIDIPAREGSPVVAAQGGTVQWAIDRYTPGFSGYGQVVVIKTDVPEWNLYAHLSAVDVQKGQRVRAGDRIGAVGRTAYSKENPTALFGADGAHLHFERSPRQYPQASANPRLDPLPILSEVIPVKTLQRLSELFNLLRAAALTRAGKPQAGVSQSLADDVAKASEDFRAWADNQPPLINATDYDQWERRYAALRARLGTAGQALPDENPDAAGPVERTLANVSAAVWGLVAAGAVYLVLRSRR